MASSTYIPIAGLIRAPSPAQSSPVQPQQQQQPEPAASPRFQQPNNIHTVSNIATASPPLQNPRVAQLQFTAGPNVSSGLSNRFPTPAASVRNSFYTASAPSSTVSLGQHFAPARPPVPPFPHSTSSIPQLPGKMVLEDLQGLGDFSAPGFEDASFSSPAMASSFDLHSSVSSSSSSNLGTVSPNDLLLQDPLMSAPNSAALTTLTSPSDYNDSPYADQFDVSPNFATGNDYDGTNQAGWFPLFALETNAAAAHSANVGAGGLQASPVSDSADSTAADRQTSSSRRKSSGHSRSTSVSGKHSSSAGVNPTRRRDKPLPPIVIDDPNDTVAMKRARNTLAARKSRERKAMRLDELEEEIAKLKQERDHWKSLALGHQG